MYGDSISKPNCDCSLDKASDLDVYCHNSAVLRCCGDRDKHPCLRPLVIDMMGRPNFDQCAASGLIVPFWPHPSWPLG